MRLSILRHAIAVPRGTGDYPGDDRPLTPKGAGKMVRAAAGIVRILDRPDVICSSPMARAAETARIVHAAYREKPRLDLAEELRPGAVPATVLGRVFAYEQDYVMIVGHEPDLSLLIGTLVGSTRGGFELKKGGLAHLTIGKIGDVYEGTLIWHVRPKHLRMLGKERD